MSGKAAKEKPLPDVPRHSRTSSSLSLQLTTLTNEGLDRLRRFTARALEEHRDSATPGRPAEEWDLWAEAIEKSLRDLGSNIARGGWLSGLKRARIQKRRRSDARDVQRRKEQALKEKQKEEEEKAAKSSGSEKNANKQVFDAMTTSTVKALLMTSEQHAKVPDEQILEQALVDLRGLASKPIVPAVKPAAMHFLLSVAAYDSMPVMTTPSQDVGADLALVPIKCTFTPSVFFLPEKIQDESGGGNMVLYGLHEWDCMLCFV